MKRLFILLVAFISLSVSAQDSARVMNTGTIRFAYLSYEQALKAVPGYELAQQSLENLKAKYEAEQKRAEQDFNLKYEEFLDGQRDFPETILRKRQTELREMLERNIAFKKDIREQLTIAEDQLFSPLKELLSSALTKIAIENGYAFILNTDQNAVPFIHPALGVDINEQVKQTLIELNTVKSVVH
jgi:outer membrane protein